MSNSDNPTGKIEVPSPLPSRRGVVQIPQTLRLQIMSALLHNNTAVKDIQKTLSSSLEEDGWTQRVEDYISNAIRTSGEEMSDVEIFDRVCEFITMGLDERKLGAGQEGTVARPELWAGEMKEREGLAVSRKAVDATVQAVEKELRDVCTVVDAVDWQAT